MRARNLIERKKVMLSRLAGRHVLNDVGEWVSLVLPPALASDEAGVLVRAKILMWWRMAALSYLEGG